jgi:hypothetical protein
MVKKQVAPLCLNPGTAASASSWWIMIYRAPASAHDYIQYGFWNCQSWCNQIWPGGQTGGQQHEFYERHNGNWDGLWRVDLGNVANGMYELRMERVNTTWRFRRDGVLRAEHSDSFRDWSLDGARFAMQAETWDQGDQLGGTNANRVRLESARWKLNANWANTGMNGCAIAPNNPNGWYGCLRFTKTVANDSVSAWTNNR